MATFTWTFRSSQPSISIFVRLREKNSNHVVRLVAGKYVNYAYISNIHPRPKRATLGHSSIIAVSKSNPLTRGALSVRATNGRVGGNVNHTPPPHAVRGGRSLAHCLWRCRRRRRHRRAWYVPAIPSRRAQVGSVKSRCKPATGAWMLRYGTLVCLAVPGAVDSLGTLALHKALANEFVFWVRHNPSWGGTQRLRKRTQTTFRTHMCVRSLFPPCVERIRRVSKQWNHSTPRHTRESCAHAELSTLGEFRVRGRFIDQSNKWLIVGGNCQLRANAFRRHACPRHRRTTSKVFRPPALVQSSDGLTLHTNTYTHAQPRWERKSSNVERWEI